MKTKALAYDNVLLIPDYSDLSSRSLADTSVDFLGRKFKLPIIPANMKDVINPTLAKWFSENDLFYIMHRFDVDNHEFVKRANEENWKLASISTGVNDVSKQSLEKISIDGYNIDVITIDVAHGFHLKVWKQIEWIKNKFPNTKIIAGNVATAEAAKSLEIWGASCVKAGIGGGKICSTRYQTGFHVPMYTCIKDICDSDIQIPVIADGGVKYMGDIAKAINAGATMIMAGGLFAECINSPAEIVNGKKQYNGSTSFAVKKENRHIEGISLVMDSGVTVEERIDEITMALQSSISYSGGKELKSLLKCDYNII